MIIFDEKTYAENIIKNGYKNEKYINYDNLILVKYWKYVGFDEKKIRENLINIMIDFQNLYNGDILEYKVNRALNIGLKYDLLTDISIDITKNDIDIINQLEDIQIRKILFILLAIWKFKGKPKRFQISNIDIMKLSGVKTNNEIFWGNIHSLIDSKLINMVEYKNKVYYTINFNNDDKMVDEVLFEINKYDNIIYYYLMLLEPDEYILCEKCGVPIKVLSNHQKYCSNCWKVIHKEQDKEYQKIKYNSRLLENR